MKSGQQSSAGACRFNTTLWSVVLMVSQGDGEQARVALEKLCQTYWYPLYAYVRGRGSDPQDAQDLVQTFFLRLLENDYLARVEQGHGKFRSFLLVCLRHFLINEWRKAATAKRGGRCRWLAFSELNPEGRFQADLAEGSTPETLYERAWATTILERARARLREKHGHGERSERFQWLERLLFEETSLSHAKVAAKLETNENTLNSELHRLRRSFRICLRAEVARTVSDPREVDEELRELIGVLRQAG